MEVKNIMQNYNGYNPNINDKNTNNYQNGFFALSPNEKILAKFKPDMKTSTLFSFIYLIPALAVFIFINILTLIYAAQNATPYNDEPYLWFTLSIIPTFVVGISIIISIVSIPIRSQRCNKTEFIVTNERIILNDGQIVGNDINSIYKKDVKSLNLIKDFKGSFFKTGSIHIEAFYCGPSNHIIYNIKDVENVYYWLNNLVLSSRNENSNR